MRHRGGEAVLLVRPGVEGVGWLGGRGRDVGVITIGGFVGRSRFSFFSETAGRRRFWELLDELEQSCRRLDGGQCGALAALTGGLFVVLAGELGEFGR